MPLEPDKQHAGVLYDFAYLDKKRIGALAAQLFESGLLTSTRETSARGDSSKQGGGIDIKLIKADIAETVSTREAIERNFDAEWSVPLDVIAALAAQNLVTASIASAKFGQVVLVEGELKIFDIATLKQMYEPMLDLMTETAKAETDTVYEQRKAILDAAMGSAQGQAKNALRAQRTQLATMKKSVEAELEANRKKVGALFSLVKILPHALQATLTNEAMSVWMTLDPDQMITNAEDFALKHGSAVPGEWSIVGMLDGRPKPAESAGAGPSAAATFTSSIEAATSGGEEADSEAEGPGTEAAEEESEPAQPAASLNDSGTIVGMMAQMQDMVHSQFGAPDSAYTITPLAIYRRVEAVPETDAVQ